MNTIKELYNQIIITEGKREATAFLTSKAIPNEIIKKILEIDQTASKYDSIQLGKYYLETQNFKIIESYYKKFQELKKSEPKLDILQYKTFHAFEQFIDSKQKKEGTIDVEGEKTPEQVRKEAIYEDQNLEIYFANTVKNACDYGHKLGQRYPFCISRSGSGNMFGGYRLRMQSAFYFIKSKTRSSAIVNGQYEDPSHMIVLDVQPNNQLMWTWADNGAQGHGTKQTNWEEILNTLPELKIPYDKGVFKPNPLTKQEKQKINNFQDISNNISLENFNKLSYDEKDEYIKSGFEINTEIFSSLDKNLRNEFVGTGSQLSDDFFQLFTPAEYQRWEETRLQILSGQI